MSIKRTSPSRVGPSRRKAAARETVPETDEPRMLSAEEKRELILAHAAARQPMDPFQRMTAVIGVVVCIVFVAGAWLYTLDGSIKKSFAQPLEPGLQNIVDTAKGAGGALNGTASDLRDQAETIGDRLRTLTAQDSVISALAEQMAAATSSRDDLFKPKPTSTTAQNK